MKKMHYKLLLLLGLMGLGSCTSNSPDDLEGNIPANVTYSQHVKPIIESNCIVCHKEPPVSGAPMPLIDYAKVKQAVEERGLLDRISRPPGAEGLMPNGGPKMPQNNIAIITKWRDQGFQN